MTDEKLKQKYGAVILLDALGASDYSDVKIKKFLSARTEINSIILNLSKELKGMEESTKFNMPSIYTFGDTIITTVELNDQKYIAAHIIGISLLMRRYLFHSLAAGILFRGAFSIGSYIEDSDSNTVMGEAVTDAVAWYAKFDWMGISSTPKTNSVLEYHFSGREKSLDDIHYMHSFAVPLKNGSTFNLYTISWPAAFFNKDFLKIAGKDNPRKWFLELLQNLPVPKGTEMKYENTKAYFTYVEHKLADKPIKQTS